MSTPTSPYTCPRCAAPIQAGQRFCANCALPLDDASLAAYYASVARPPSPAPALPPPVRRRESQAVPAVLLVAVLLCVGWFAFGQYWVRGSRPTAAPAARAPAPAAAAPSGPQTVTGQGATHASAPVTLAGGDYQIDWLTYPVDSSWALPTWRLGASLRAASGASALLFSAERIDATGHHSGQALATGVPAGTYVLDVAAADSCAWSITLTPR